MTVAPDRRSLAEKIAALPEAERERILADLDMQQVQWDWGFWGRPAQQEPTKNPRTDDGSWLTWLILAGRGFGKTRSGSEWIRDKVTGRTPMSGGRYRRIALIAETAADGRDVMVQGDGGILAVHPPGFRPVYTPSLRKLEWPNGAVAHIYNGVEPDQLRGPEHDLAWMDELAKWRHAQETFDNLQFGLRRGRDPKQLVTTTPRPIKIIRDLKKDPRTVLTEGSTKENRANLAPAFLQTVVAKYEGTRLGRQELDAELLDDIPGALWTRKMIDDDRLGSHDKLPDFARVVVGIDPSGTKGDSDGESNEVGIVVAARGVDGHGYIIADGSCDLSPEGWGRRAIDLYKQNKADRIVAETNYGGAMVEAVIRSIDRKVSYRSVTATRGKVVRAEPISALYEQHKIHHIGSFAQLEDQMCAMTGSGYVGDGSPDRADAAVWALTELMLGGPGYRINL